MPHVMPWPRRARPPPNDHDQTEWQLVAGARRKRRAHARQRPIRKQSADRRRAAREQQRRRGKLLLSSAYGCSEGPVKPGNPGRCRAQPISCSRRAAGERPEPPPWSRNRPRRGSGRERNRDPVRVVPRLRARPTRSIEIGTGRKAQDARDAPRSCFRVRRGAPCAPTRDVSARRTPSCGRRRQSSLRGPEPGGRWLDHP